MRFVDEVRITIASGNGGDGCVSFLRERFRPRGGPDGGNGGRGGSVILEATRQRNTLVDLRWNKVYRAPSGTNGQGRGMTGASGEDLVIPVPVGTQVHSVAHGDLLADLAAEGDRFEVPGGRGGRGNATFKTSTRRTPRFATEGRPGVEVELLLELKLIADIGLLGFPNAGKSTLISRISAAKPKIASYPFTTLVPNLGVVRLSDGKSFVVADIPGLIEGAAEGVGLGHRFLKHVERCAGYLHLISLDEHEATSPLERFRALNEELRRYDESLSDRPQIVVLSKTDLLPPDQVERIRAELERELGTRVFALSAVSGDGLRELIGATWTLVSRVRHEAPPEALSTPRSPLLHLHRRSDEANEGWEDDSDPWLDDEE
ncbi:MAG: GTPase ObgE [Deltaproteobacteria bacterium]|nr:MAG: GTPase ObgE [Deltaproteobacteria bacterium]